MAVQATLVPVKMTAGVDEKSDPKSLQTKLTLLQNGSFQSPGQIEKRDGFQQLPSLSKGLAVATFKKELVSMDGSNIFSYSPEANINVQKSLMVPSSLTTASVVSSSLSQLNIDEAYDPVTGLKCFTWTNENNALAAGVFYSIVDTKTGASIISGNIVDLNGTLAKPAYLNGHFFIVYFSTFGNELSYVTIPTGAPTTISGVTNISGVNNPPAFDVTSANNQVYVAFANTSAVISVYSLTFAGVGTHINAATANFSDAVSISIDGSGNVWVAQGGPDTDVNSVFVVNSALTTTILAPTVFTSTTNLRNICTNVQGTTITIYSEIAQTNSSGSFGLSNFVRADTVTITGTVAHIGTIMKGVGLASKCINYNGVNYFLAVYDGSWQLDNSVVPPVYKPSSIEPTFFLINGSGKIVLKLAPSLAGGYLKWGTLPELVTIATGVFSCCYLIEENEIAVNGVITFQTGGNVATISFVLSNPPQKVEYGNNLHISGGQLWMYDAKSVVEHGFHIFPEFLSNASMSVGGGIGIGASTASINQVQYSGLYEWVDQQGQLHRSAPSIPITVTLPSHANTTPINFTASYTEGSMVLTALSGLVTGGFVGQVIQDNTVPTAFPAGTYFTSFDIAGSTATVSQPAQSSGTADSFSTYDVFSNVIIFPTLRQTLKVGVSLVLYRTENNGTIFYRVTAPTSNTATPYNAFVPNQPTVDTVSIVDSLPDAVIVGNEELYTTGGIVENIAAPAVSAIATFKNRTVYLSPENPCQWGFSQQVINGSPVEFNSEEFVENIDQQIGQALALAPLDDKLILFGPTSKYYVVGQGPTPNGTSNDFTDATKIAGVAGCSNPIAVVEIPDGLLFQDIEKGIYLLTRNFNEIYKGADVESFNGIPITSVQKFENQNKVIFTLSTGANLIYDWYVDQWEVDPFPSPAADSCNFQGTISYIQTNGILLQQTPGVFSDNGSIIPLELQTGWIPFAGLEGFLRVWELQIMGTYFSPHTLTVTIYNDFSTTPSQVVTIPVLSNPGLYQFRIRIKQQKCETIMVNITESQSGSPGQGFALSSLAFRVAQKKGLFKLPAGASY